MLDKLEHESVSPKMLERRVYLLFIQARSSEICLAVYILKCAEGKKISFQIIA